ncbi:MAG: radical SAM protein [Firmicutes bacterium]|nr:radical SAM protein [Bacillota bacterium]
MVTDILRRLVLGKKEKFIFKGYNDGLINFNNIDKDIGIYIHIPFCKTICPYCPYNKVLYKKDKAKEYKNALLKELILYKDKLADKSINSIYIGGGTPTLLVDELTEVIEYIKEKFNFNKDIGIEIYPTEVNNKLLKKLKKIGITLISLGVQTFDNDKLKFLGRDYTKKDIEKSIKLIKEYDFKCLDVDIMTNIPGQAINDIEYDLKKAYSYDIDQISIYPLIVFPMTNMDRVIKEKKLTRFNEFKEKKILNIIDKISNKYGYKRNSVWTYGKNDDIRYTSVTRESFIGIGAGASSLFRNFFYLNTFNLEEYIKIVNKDKLPINIVNVMSEKEKMIFWLFWRCYDGVIDKERFRKLFNKDMEKEFKLLFLTMKLFNIAKWKDSKVILTNWGRYIYHYIEKQYSIHYLNKVWERSMKEPWIDKLTL